MIKNKIGELEEQIKYWDSPEAIIAKALLEIAKQLDRFNNNFLKSQEKIDLPR